MGALEKTDRIDAAVLARDGLGIKARSTPPQSPQAQRLKALVARLSQLAADITVNKQRRSAAADTQALASLDERAGQGVCSIGRRAIARWPLPRHRLRRPDGAAEEPENPRTAGDAVSRRGWRI
jgi:transposase